jgi:hypothetical protein
MLTTRYAVGACCLMLLIGCAAPQQAVLPDGPPVWQEGHRHGYNRALALLTTGVVSPTTGLPVTFTQGQGRMTTDMLYRDGWSTGFTVAKTRIELHQRERHQLESIILGPPFR